ncbi:DUF5995 family protein [Streptomyces sp. ODS28]|uniref:DUF5995 family protein n=1 Tax=Streptomyces sp. ODS28 TaxID=3136688 RepID=UPI0031E6135F
MTSAEQAPERERHAADVGEIVGRMAALGAGLPERDGVAVFNRVYLSVTRELERRLAAHWFGNAGAAAELGSRFARFYLDAVRAWDRGGRVSACWLPLFQLRAHPGVRPLQYALSGINAHIGHDLPLALVETCRARGCEPESLEGDFERIGELLTGLEERIREDLMPGPDLLDVADPLTHLVGCWSLEQAREGAWGAFRALWGLRGLPELAESFAGRLDATVGLAGRFLLTPLP